MKKAAASRRAFLKDAATTAAGMVMLSSFPKISEAKPSVQPMQDLTNKYAEPRIRFSVIGINHGHINSQVEAVTRGGGQFVSFYAKEPDLAADFAKRFPKVK